MLTDQQIDSLFAFCEKHYVHYYDAQVELVDHLANAIEEKMRDKKEISFETALEQVYAGFGVMGFGAIVSSRLKGLDTRYQKMKWKLFLSYFAWPKAALTACLLFAFLFLGKFLFEELLYSMMYAISICLFAFDLVSIRGAALIVKKQKKKLMLTEMSAERTWLSFIFVSLLLDIFLGGVFFSNKNTVLSYTGYLFFVSTATMYLFATISYRQVVKTTKAMALKQYPAAFSEPYSE